jgi:hypothetical protein
VGFTCDPQASFGCAWGPDGVTLAEGTYCITYDNFTCLSDQGESCNFTGSEGPWCNILNETQSCLTLDG